MMTRAWLWLRSTLFRGRLEREMDEDMSMHLERSTDRFRADGFSPGEARVAAYRTFGNVAAIKEDARDARGVESVIADVRYGVRGIERRTGTNIGRELSYPEYRDDAAQTSLFTDVAAWTSSDIVLGVRGSDGSTQETLFSGAATYATSNYFPVLGIRPVHGAGLPLNARPIVQRARTDLTSYDSGFLGLAARLRPGVAAATCIPSRRAAAIDPLLALRAE